MIQLYSRTKTHTITKHQQNITVARVLSVFFLNYFLFYTESYNIGTTHLLAHVFNIYNNTVNITFLPSLVEVKLVQFHPI